jgi:hypothetical protein
MPPLSRSFAKMPSRQGALCFLRDNHGLLSDLKQLSKPSYPLGDPSPRRQSFDKIGEYFAMRYSETFKTGKAEIFARLPLRSQQVTPSP